jgi:hypothetical protein
LATERDQDEFAQKVRTSVDRHMVKRASNINRICLVSAINKTPGVGLGREDVANMGDSGDTGLNRPGCEVVVDSIAAMLLCSEGCGDSVVFSLAGGVIYGTKFKAHTLEVQVVGGTSRCSCSNFLARSATRPRLLPRRTYRACHPNPW